MRLFSFMEVVIFLFFPVHYKSPDTNMFCFVSCWYKPLLWSFQSLITEINFQRLIFQHVRCRLGLFGPACHLTAKGLPLYPQRKRRRSGSGGMEHHVLQWPSDVSNRLKAVTAGPLLLFLFNHDCLTLPAFDFSFFFSLFNIHDASPDVFTTSRNSLYLV